MTIKDKIATLERRLAGLNKRVVAERNKLNRLRHKSRHVRQCSGLGPRIGYFADRIIELELVIRFMKGKMKPEQFEKFGNGDDFDSVINMFFG